MKNRNDQIRDLKKFKVDYNAYFGRIKNKKKQTKTIPKGPSMMQRENKKSIVQ